MRQYRFIQPLDVLHFRGNRLFGESSDGGAALMPPWPSVFAGALRSWILAHSGANPARYAAEAQTMGGALARVLGTPAEPGGFSLAELMLGEKGADGQVSPLYPVPADIQIFESPAEPDSPEPHQLRPVPLPAGVATSLPLPMMPALSRETPAKPLAGYWLTGEGWKRYLHGECPATGELRKQSELWKLDRRLGIELDSSRRSTVEGQLYTTDAICLKGGSGVGFVVGIDGVEDETLPTSGVLRLGGDGRGAAVSGTQAMLEPEPDWALIEREGAFRLVLTTPGLFPEGWRLPGLQADGTWAVPGASARLLSAAVPRGTTVSGWDLVERRPKSSERAAPAGSVYWFEGLDGSVDALRKLSATGLWGLGDDNNQPARRAEGFNRFAIANA